MTSLLEERWMRFRLKIQILDADEILFEYSSMAIVCRADLYIDTRDAKINPEY